MPTKKHGEKVRGANEPSVSRAQKSKTKKRGRPVAPGAKYLPAERIGDYSLPASEGHETLSVPSDFATVSLTYSDKVIRQIFHGLFTEFLKSVRKRRSHTFRAPATGLDMKVVGAAHDQKINESGDEAAAYADLAVTALKEKLVYALHSFSDQLLLQAVIATLNGLLKGGHLSLSENFHLKEIWSEYLSSYERAAKAHWAPMARGQRAYWPPAKLLALARAYESNRALARGLKGVYESKDSRRWREGQWKTEVRREFGAAYDWVLDRVPTKKEKYIASLLTSKQFGLYESESRDGVAGIGKRLKGATALIERMGQPDLHIPPYDEEAEESKFTILDDE
jgi:hypothetical protein